MNYQKANVLLLLFVLLLGFSCEKDDVNTTQGTARIEITDAPIDDTNVSGAFVTIADVKVDGQSIEGFNKTTIDLLAYQNGNTLVLGDIALDASSYSKLSLVLDYDQDENGNSPGCYIAETDGTQQALMSSTNEFEIDYDFAVEANNQTSLVIDFDLRKAIAREEPANGRYQFVSAAEMNNALRGVAKAEAGTIKGNCNDVASGSEKIVVYAYTKGTYDRNAELQAQGESGVEFRNAVTSATVDGGGDYELHFLEAGEYELHFVSYTDQNNDGTLEVQGTLLVEVLTALDLSAVQVEANTSVSIDVLVTGILPL